MAWVRRFEEADIRIGAQRVVDGRGRRAQLLVTRAPHDAGGAIPVITVSLARQLIDERGQLRRRSPVASWPVLREIPREEEIALVAEGVEEPVRRGMRSTK